METFIPSLANSQQIALDVSDKRPHLLFRYEELLFLATWGLTSHEINPEELFAQQHMCLMQPFPAHNFASLGMGWIVAFLMTRAHDTQRHQMFRIWVGTRHSRDGRATPNVLIIEQFTTWGY